ncbi:MULTISPECIES: hypothetical protein [Paenibacillus]|uniref:hypothetical protein n=1 Tax=Paenibacillus TaxID=44249 RepID=UPI000F541FFF|nr:hypothetical protein [Paenibacillus xylanexedens]RPK20042.1 hypothetical protein EDO6_06559 [Paenibacillus xylanexedens]
MNIMDIFSQYWGILAVIVGGGVYFFTHKQVAMSFAKKQIQQLMLAAEKGAESLVLENGDAKLQFVVDKVYDILPPAVKLFVSKQVLTMLVQSLFDEVKEIIEAHKVKG